MDEKSMKRVEGFAELSVVAVAITGSRKTKHVITWALDKFVPEGVVYFKLLHVRTLVSIIPTPTAYKKEMEWQAAEKLLPYKRMCSQRKVQVEIAQIESDDVVAAITGDIQKHRISTLVIGASSRSIFSRARTLSSNIAERCPPFCTVYAVSKGKLSSIRPADSETNQSFRDDSSDTSSVNSSTNTWCSRTDRTDQGSFAHFRSASLPMQRFQALSTFNLPLLHSRTPSSGVVDPKSPCLEAQASNATNLFSNDLDVSQASSFTSSVAENSLLQHASTSETSTKDQQDDVNFELEKLRIELRHIREMYAMAQGEAIDASRKLNELQKRHLEEEIHLKLELLKEEEAKELARLEKKRYEDASREAEIVKECAKREAMERKEAEIQVSRQTKEKENLESILNGNFYQYRQYTWEEIISSTSSFSEDLKIGMGAYGTVYKCSFQHTTAAVKVLHAKEGSRVKQFEQELKILSKIRHPHLLILLGACPEQSCLVYEFMENGSLEDRLFRKDKTPPLLRFDRVRIAWEVASALVFLHNSKPRAIIHRDLKPANILLDRNYVSKIGDVGLSTMVSEDSLLVSTAYKDTAPVGTLCYIDPEYQRTGIVCPKSDVYAFGMVVLQLLTAKPAIALAHKVENAVEDDRLLEVLDPECGTWPIEEAKGLALIALKCTELRRRDRPDLQDEVLPVLEKLKDVAERARDKTLVSAPPPPKHFICPILKEVMSDPCVAADGYTYERRAIEAWLTEKDTSPITELSLPHKHLIRSFALLSAIMEWKQT
ncbi:U-box domain-containing protein 35-like isoform X4 [Salvia splendens]|uniref:U-box domain-containing protein 35-like isoform X4 n=1 Tax=Salvia splendens TaxID=180675 RepID=UPI001C280F97|nr:U-box domain-containing protein 35-like isoform X4 [Salvia splendens]